MLGDIRYSAIGSMSFKVSVCIDVVGSAELRQECTYKKGHHTVTGMPLYDMQLVEYYTRDCNSKAWLQLQKQKTNHPFKPLEDYPIYTIVPVESALLQLENGVFSTNAPNDQIRLDVVSYVVNEETIYAVSMWHKILPMDTPHVDVVAVIGNNIYYLSDKDPRYARILEYQNLADVLQK